MKELLIGFAVFALLVAAAFADWVPEDGHKMHFPQMPDVAGRAVNATQPVILADDWMCAESGPVTDVHFWGSWSGGNEGVVISFQVSIHENIPGTSRPGNPLWERSITNFVVAAPHDPPSSQAWYDPSTCEFIPDDHTPYFLYNILDIPEPFVQTEGEIYWLNISATVADPVNTHWGWKSTQDHWEDDAVWGISGELNWIEMLESPPYPYVPGDLNMDGFVDAIDWVILYNYFFEGGPPPSYFIPCTDPPFYAAADVNGDCTVDASDVDALYGVVFYNNPAEYCALYPPGFPPSLDLAFVITASAPEDIPTLNEWGMLIMALLLLATGTVAVIRRRQATFSRSD